MIIINILIDVFIKKMCFWDPRVLCNALWRLLQQTVLCCLAGAFQSEPSSGWAMLVTCTSTILMQMWCEQFNSIYFVFSRSQQGYNQQDIEHVKVSLAEDSKM
jgi:hypothetical protein